MHAHVADESAELLKVDLAVVVLVGKLDGLVHDLLELRVFQVGAYHLEKLKQLSVADVAVVVDVVDLEGELQLRHFVPLDAELAHALYELLEVYLSVAVLVENLNDPLDERVPLQLGV